MKFLLTLLVVQAVTMLDPLLALLGILLGLVATTHATRIVGAIAAAFALRAALDLTAVAVV